MFFITLEVVYNLIIKYKVFVAKYKMAEGLEKEIVIRLKRKNCQQEDCRNNN